MKGKTLSFYLLSTLCTYLIACSEKPPEEEEKSIEQQSNQVVLIFDQAPKNSSYTWPDGVISGNAPPFEIRYIDDHHIVRHFTPNLAPEKDTLVLKSKRNIIEVQHAYLGIDKLSYLFNNGDSVLFSYRDRKPIAKILNREAKPFEVNYDLHKREYIVGDNFPGLLRIHARFAFRDTAFQEIKDINKRVEKAREEGINAALTEFHKELEWLDSLRREKIISPESYEFYKTKISFDIANQQFHYAPEVTKQLAEGSQKLLSPRELLQTSFEPSSGFFHYHEMLNGIRVMYFSSKADQIKTSNARYPDYRQVYGSIKVSSQISPEIKRLLLFTTIDDLINNFSLDDREKYWQKFKEDVPDSAFISYISNKYHLNKEVSNELQLKTLNDKNINFEDVLARYQNKVVYVDFWASWCAPCIRALPASRELHEAYKDKDVVFIYLSKDEDIQKWKQAANKYNLNDSLQSYVIDNQYTSRMLDDLQVRSIPRYMIYDKKGRLSHENAPGPGSMETRRLLDKYLAE